MHVVDSFNECHKKMTTRVKFSMQRLTSCNFNRYDSKLHNTFAGTYVIATMPFYIVKARKSQNIISYD